MTHAEGSLGDSVRRGRDEASALREEVAAIAGDLRDLAKTEVELVKAELREQKSVAMRIAIWGGVAALMALVMLFFVFLTVMFALDTAMPLWAAALITTGIITAIAAVAGLLAYQQVKRLTVVPKKTISSVQEDVRWAKDQLKSSATLSTGGAP
ncbi:MAG: phage holin family protein [Dehalococcoidia bacterium]|nr:phage holin family protein [Dehalococcoidia bacterium]